MRASFERAPVTTLLLLAIGAVFVLEILQGGLQDARTLIDLGANYAPGVADGELWRLVTSLFLHGGLLHLLVNGWALYQLGTLMEVLVGSRRFAGVYFTTGIGASVASFFFSRGLSVGASGAIFGILGALLTFLYRRRDRLHPRARSLMMQLLFWAGINVFLGFTVPAIDNAAHLGGLGIGLVSGALLAERPRPPAVE